MNQPQAQPQELIERLGLLPHPEGGYYRETYRSTTKVATPRGERCASTAILFLLTAGQCSHWHRICADELWLHQGGGGLLIHELSPAGAYRRTRLGLDLAAGETPPTSGARRPLVWLRTGGRRWLEPGGLHRGARL